MKKLIALSVLILGIQISYSQKILTPTDEGSKVHFVIKNFGIKTGGDFKGLKGTLKFDANNLSVWAFDVTIDASSIDTDNGSRDGHLRKSDYFDVKTFPVIRLVSTKIQSTDKPGIYSFSGDLTIKGTTKPVKFNFKVLKRDDGYVFTGEFPLNRRDFKVGDESISLADNLKVSLSIFAK
jgi:polyisoprenoid-binding protein YceI